MKVSRNNFLIYCTANEGKFLLDVYNIYKMSQLDAGVGTIQLIIVISDLSRANKWETAFLKTLERIVNNSSTLELMSIIKKGNIGRDFSSAKIGLEQLEGIASKNDFVLIRNRSSVGPQMKNWYGCYANLLTSNVGLVGNTINLMGNPKGMTKEVIQPHVQTYLYLSKYEILHSVVNNFPAINETDRIKIIERGEVGLSKLIMTQGYEVTSFNWKDVTIGVNWIVDHSLPKKDIKEQTRNLPFIHRKALSWVHRKGFSWTKLYRIKLTSIFIITMNFLSFKKENIEIQKINRFYL